MLFATVILLSMIYCHCLLSIILKNAFWLIYWAWMFIVVRILSKWPICESAEVLFSSRYMSEWNQSSLWCLRNGVLEANAHLIVNKPILFIAVLHCSMAGSMCQIFFLTFCYSFCYNAIIIIMHIAVFVYIHNWLLFIVQQTNKLLLRSLQLELWSLTSFPVLLARYRADNDQPWPEGDLGRRAHRPQSAAVHAIPLLLPSPLAQTDSWCRHHSE